MSTHSIAYIREWRGQEHPPRIPPQIRRGLHGSAMGKHIAVNLHGIQHRLRPFVIRTRDTSGTALLEYREGGELWLDMIAVREKQRGKGIGTALLQCAMDYAYLCGRDLYLVPGWAGEGQDHTDRLEAWYARHGFTRTGETKVLGLAPCVAPVMVLRWGSNPGYKDAWTGLKRL